MLSFVSDLSSSKTLTVERSYGRAKPADCHFNLKRINGCTFTVSG
uniref:Uncharacterized protein n=1 Tax=Klebsiella pneumoniae TaxID=573 RepID=A0A8B0SS81_KLEPN|nr:hypothetical protein [Klebsiella pneumoniae]